MRDYFLSPKERIWPGIKLLNLCLKGPRKCAIAGIAVWQARQKSPGKAPRTKKLRSSSSRTGNNNGNPSLFNSQVFFKLFRENCQTVGTTLPLLSSPRNQQEWLDLKWRPRLDQVDEEIRQKLEGPGRKNEWPNPAADQEQVLREIEETTLEEGELRGKEKSPQLLKSSVLVDL